MPLRQKRADAAQARKTPALQTLRAPTLQRSRVSVRPFWLYRLLSEIWLSSQLGQGRTGRRPRTTKIGQSSFRNEANGWAHMFRNRRNLAEHGVSPADLWRNPDTVGQFQPETNGVHGPHFVFCLAWHTY